jgi:hypothetical protein
MTGDAVRPLISRPRRLGPVGSLALLGLCSALLFLVLGSYRLDRPGYYADELLFAPASAETLGQCDVDAQVARSVGECFPVYLNPPYLGALKAWLHAPLMAAESVAPATLRAPMLLLGALVVLGWVILAGRAFGPAVGFACALVLGLDPAFMIHARLDWGPVVLAAFFKLVLLVATWRWLERGARWMLALAIATALAGIYDKLNFLWVVAGVGCAVLLAAPDRLAARLRERPRGEWLLWIVACVPAVALVGMVALNASRLDVAAAGTTFDPAAIWARIRPLYDQAMSAAFVRGWLGDGAAEPVAWPSRVLLALPVLAVVLAALRPWRWPDLRDALRLVVFLFVTLFACAAALAITPQVGGAHHLVVLWPLPWVVGLAMLHLVARTIRHAVPRAGVGLAGAVLVVAAAFAAIPTFMARHQELRALWDGRFGFATAFDPAIEELSARIEGGAAVRVVSVDWGLHQGLVAWAPAARRGRYVDGWTAFNDPPGVGDERKDHMREVALRELPVVFVAHAKGRAILPGTEANFDAILGLWSACAEAPVTVAGSDGRALYSLVEVRRVDPACARPP